MTKRASNNEEPRRASTNVVVTMKVTKGATETLLDLARGLADYMMGGTGSTEVERLGYNERLVITQSLRAMVEARRTEQWEGKCGQPS